LNNRKIDILDSTLRDGEQSNFITFSIDEKLEIVELLDKLGIKYIEGGNPAANHKEIEFFNRVKMLDLNNSKIVAFGTTRRKNTSVSQDLQIEALNKAETDYVCIAGKCWDFHVKEVLGTNEAENLKMIEDTCSFFSLKGKHVFFDAEHFFDGFKTNPDFSLKALDAAKRGGAMCFVLCDTNGGSFPDEIFNIVTDVFNSLGDVALGFHGHNDTGMAVANSVMAVKAGVSHVQGTYLGFGERCGNANLSTLIPDLQLKREIDCIPLDNLRFLTKIANRIAKISNITICGGTPYIGASAFTHKAGMHADGVIKSPSSFEHIDPKTVGNIRSLPLSELTGKATIFQKISKIFPNIKKNSLETQNLISIIKTNEEYAYKSNMPDASFEVLCYRIVENYSSFFKLIYCEVMTAFNSGKVTANVKLEVDRIEKSTTGIGDDIMSAIYNSLKSELEIFYPELYSIRLIDYDVKTVKKFPYLYNISVSMEDELNSWMTEGISKNIVEAVCTALIDSFDYKLINSSRKSVAMKEANTARRR